MRNLADCYFFRNLLELYHNLLLPVLKEIVFYDHNVENNGAESIYETFSDFVIESLEFKMFISAIRATNAEIK